MQLKIVRSQRETGVFSSTALFCLDARVAFTPEEQQSITRYKLHREVIYNSEAARRHLERGDAHRDGSLGGNLKALAAYAMAATKLTITVGSIQSGHHIECKSLEELIGAENALYEACQSLRTYLDTAATFDGREIVVAFADGEPEIVAMSETPKLIAPPPAPTLVAATPEPQAIEYQGSESDYLNEEPAPEDWGERLSALIENPVFILAPLIAVAVVFALILSR